MSRVQKVRPMVAVYALLYWAVAVSCVVPVFGQLLTEYPSLIVREEQYEELRARSLNSPWSDMMAMAIETTESVAYDLEEDVLSRAEDMKSIVSANALLYILDPENKPLYRRTIRDTLAFWPDLSGDPAADDPDHDYTVGVGSAFFNSVLALDIIHDDLTLGERATLETELQVMADWFQENGLGSWATNGYGCLVVWAAYTKDRELLDSAKAKYREEFVGYLTDSGVFRESTQYSKSRAASDRDAKVYTMDVLEFLGEDEYYDDPQVIGLYEWIYGGGTSSTRINATFGDTSPRRKVDTGPRTYNLHQFSELAAGHAAWVLGNADRYRGELLYYVLMDRRLAPSQKPTSRIWKDGHAAFWEQRESTESLMVALSSVDDEPNGHAHNDVNSIYFSAFGESVLLNSGYAGWENGIDEDGDGIEEWDWAWIHDNARSSNTASIGRMDHASKRGGGIEEGFTTRFFDYASGYSGPALSNGEHWRNLCFIHPQDGKQGYVLLFDEFQSESEEGVFLFLHPDSSQATEVVPNSEYLFTVQRRRDDEETYLSVLLATPPAVVSLEDGGLGIGLDSYTAQFLDVEYPPTAADGHQNIVTVLFPHDTGHPAAAMSPVSGVGYTGALVDLGDSVIDVALESFDANKSVRFGASSFTGKAAYFREIGNVLSSYFVRKGKKFLDGAETGFNATAPVTVSMAGTSGSLITGVNTVTFRYPGISGVLLNGVEQEPVNEGPGWLSIEILFQIDGTSNYDVELLTE